MQSFIRSRSNSPSSPASPSQISQVTKEVLKTTLKVAEKVLDGVPIPGAKGVIGVLLEVISGLEVGRQHTSVTIPIS